MPQLSRVQEWYRGAVETCRVSPDLWARALSPARASSPARRIARTTWFAPGQLAIPGLISISGCTSAVSLSVGYITFGPAPRAIAKADQ